MGFDILASQDDVTQTGTAVVDRCMLPDTNNVIIILVGSCLMAED
jgi:hypothetical protein